ncbi:hypothetical protein CUREO4125_06230 [Campylobacter ureolyticus]|uniref:hypothetical protein n=1 Tax=Campylobacter ureolyticus TaxID=827 RepID=UPI00215A9F55|nr:hypothetical protein [Campylobacter ureolyticus]MCR8699974.1 hypothetical protein [Campylobacter ureolyticus]
MSDDKREKLIEYLRNNRPKNRANLGNNPYENSNNELDDLNSDENLNLDNSQISGNKNSNQRDYDKEPLIVKNYDPFLCSQMPLLFILFINSVFLFENKFLLYFCILLSIVTLSVILYCYFTIFNNYEIKIYKTKIDFLKNNMVKDSYKLDKNTIKDNFRIKELKDKYLFLLIGFFIITINFEEPFYSLIPIVSILSVYLYQNLLLCIIFYKNNKTFKNFWKFRRVMNITIDFYDIGEVFYHFGKGIWLKVFSYRDYRSLRIYFLMNFGFDINKK